MLAATLGKGKPLFGEFTVRHPENKNAELLWHCGQFPLSQKAEDSEACLVNQREWFTGKDGTYTVVRIDQEYGNYMMVIIDNADLIISKGQGNFETLHHCGRNIYYLFLCKCKLFADRFGVETITGMFINDLQLKP